MDSVLAFFQTQLSKIVVSLKPHQPTHTLGPKKPSMNQQESKHG